jgi:hypothetical protein
VDNTQGTPIQEGARKQRRWLHTGGIECRAARTGAGKEGGFFMPRLHRLGRFCTKKLCLACGQSRGGWGGMQSALASGSLLLLLSCYHGKKKQALVS